MVQNRPGSCSPGLLGASSVCPLTLAAGRGCSPGVNSKAGPELRVPVPVGASGVKWDGEGQGLWQGTNGLCHKEQGDHGAGEPNYIHTQVIGTTQTIGNTLAFTPSSGPCNPSYL